MRALFEDIDSKRGTNSFLAYRYSVNHFPFQWHYHPEYELTLILKGAGKRMVGDSHENFYAGDLVLLGPDLPHTWVSDEASAAVVIQFSEAFMTPLLQYPECERIRKLLGRSALGICLTPKRSMLDAIERLPAQKGVGRIAGLLQVLQALAGSSGRSLASPFFQPSRGRDAEGRINKVCLYIQRHACEKVSLSRIASLINLSDSACCKFFKRTMGRTFSDYVVDIRIGHACHLLSETDQPISEIAYGSGFDSLTYFNRVFLRKKGVRPREFRKGLSDNIQHGGDKVPSHRGRS